MPVQYLSLEDTNNSILKRAMFGVVKEIVAKTGMPDSAIIALQNGVEINRTDNSTNTSLNQTPNLPSTVSSRRVIAKITDNYNEDSLTNTIVSQADAYPIFRDNQISVSVYPVYVKTDFVINLEYTTPSKSEAKRLRDEIRVRLSQTRNILHHDVEYDILLPKEVTEFIADVHELKNRLYPITLDEYFLANSTKRVHTVTDLVGTVSNTVIAVRERQVRIVGVFDFSPEPDAIESDNETNTYKLNLPYKFSMDVARGMCIKYPTMFCNRTLPEKYLKYIEEAKIKTREEYTRNLGATHSLASLSSFESHQQLAKTVNVKLPIALPLFDDYRLRVGHNGYVILASFLTDVNETDRVSLFNLKELGDYYMDLKLLEYISAEEYKYCVNPYMSYFYFGLHQEGAHLDNNILEIDTDLNVKSKKKLSLLKPVRVCLSVCVDTTYLDPTVTARMVEHRDMYLLYLTELISAYSNYKHEIARLNITENTFYRNFVTMLNAAINREDYDFIKEFFHIFKADRRMLQVLVGILKHSYPRLYAKLLQVTDLQSYGYTSEYKRTDRGVEQYAMRSVMYLRASIEGRL